VIKNLREAGVLVPVIRRYFAEYFRIWAEVFGPQDKSADELKPSDLNRIMAKKIMCKSTILCLLLNICSARNMYAFDNNFTHPAIVGRVVNVKTDIPSLLITDVDHGGGSFRGLTCPGLHISAWQDYSF